MKKILFFLIAVFALSIVNANPQNCDCESYWAWKWSLGKPMAVMPGTIEDSYFTLLREGNDLYNDGQYWQAIDKYKKMIDIEDCLPDPFYEIASCYVKLDMEFQAMEYYKKACDRADCDGWAIEEPTFSCRKYQELRKKLLGY